MNLGQPPGRLGWFYQFKDTASGDELFVQVLDQELHGSTVAHPLVEELPYTFQPIDLGKVRFDSSAILAQYLDTEDGKAHLSQRQDVEWDFRLVQVNASPNPVWSLFDVQNLGRSLLSIDAATGKSVDDPLP